MHYVITIVKSSFESGVAQRRLRLKMDTSRPGVITENQAVSVVPLGAMWLGWSYGSHLACRWAAESPSQGLQE